MSRIKIRKIVFGIRFKLSLVMILAILFVSLLIGLAVYKQQERKIEDAMLRLGTTTLQGVSDLAQQYLNNKHILAKTKELTAAQKMKKYKDQNDILKKLAQYFTSVVRKDAILDFTFLVDITWKDIGVDWKKWNQSRYSYFNKRTGRIITYGSGRKDHLLEPTMLSHYMQNIDAGPYITYTDLLEKKKVSVHFKNVKKNYVLIGMPIFHSNPDANIYKKYIDFTNATMTPGGKIEDYYKSRKNFTSKFMKRIINHNLTLNYSINLDEKKIKTIFWYYLSRITDLSEFNYSQKKELAQLFSTNLVKNFKLSKIKFKEFSATWDSFRKKNKIAYLKTIKQPDIWKKFYRFIKRNKFEISPLNSLEELALFSFRKDLTGILGIFLERKEFYAKIENDRNELFNLIISILIRSIFVAIFFPTFLILTIDKVTNGATKIGKGDFDTRVKVKGTDEMGRLADVLNVMATNLKKAQDLKIEKLRMENELQTAQLIQEALLPEQLPDIANIEFGVYYSAQTESGGDYYDFIPIDDDQLGVTVADVSGHGIGSGLVMAMTRTLLHAYCKEIQNPKKIFEHINLYLKENTASNYFVTMFYGILNLKDLTLSYSSAGHSQGLVLRNGNLEELPAGGIALGAADNSMLSKLVDVKKIILQKGDYFIQFSDGVDEAMNAKNDEFGLERFYAALKTSNGKSPQQMIDTVVRELKKFTGTTPQHDDITLIALRIK